MANGHKVIPFEDVLQHGSNDIMVCTAAQANDAVLVAFDKDMKTLAKRWGVGAERFKRLNLIRFSCKKPMGVERLKQAMSLIEHEWQISDAKAARRLFVEIGTDVIRTYR